MINKINEICNIQSLIYKNKSIYNLCWNGINALTFFQKIYKNSNPLFRLNRKYDRFLEWEKTQFVPTIRQDSKILSYCTFYKTDHNAIIPLYNSKNDLEFDLTIIKKNK